MGFMKEDLKLVFDTASISKGMLLCAARGGSDCWKGGFVTDVSENELVLQFYPGISGVTNHMCIKASEVEEGDWRFRWSRDYMESVLTFPEQGLTSPLKGGDAG